MVRLYLFLKLFIIFIGRYRSGKFEFTVLIFRRGLLLGRLAGFNGLDSVFRLVQRIVQFVSQPVEHVECVDFGFINQTDRFGVSMRDNSLRLFPRPFGDGVFADNLDRLLLGVGDNLLRPRLRITENAIALGNHALAFLDRARYADTHLIYQP